METEYKNLSLEKVSMDELKEHNSAYLNLFSKLSIIELSNEFLAYKTDLDKRAPEYKILCDEIMLREQPEHMKGKSLEEIAKNNKMTKTDESSLNFYDRLSIDGIKPESAGFAYLRQSISDVFGYEDLNIRGSEVKNETSESAKWEPKTEKLLPNTPSKNVRSFAIASYIRGKSVWKRMNEF